MVYSKEKLNSKGANSFYESIAKRTLNDIYVIEGEVSRTNKKRDLKVSVSDKSFELFNNTISYTGIIKSNGDGYYLSIDAMKEINENGLDVTLCAGIQGFDIATGEKYDRKLAKVNYSYAHGKITINSIMDEEDLALEEEKRLKEVNNQVLKMKL